jgi:hypothetical protein
MARQINYISTKKYLVETTQKNKLSQLPWDLKKRIFKKNIKNSTDLKKRFQ